MFGDDVVDVRHIADARPNRHAVWFALAGLALVVTAVVFGLTLEQVAAGDRSGNDFATMVALVGLGLGTALATIATFRWKARTFPGYRIGRDGDVELPVDVAPMALVAWTGTGFVVQRGDGVDIDGRHAARLDIPRDGHIVARIGDAIRISITRVATPSGLAPRAAADPLLIRCFAISLALHAVLWGFVEATPVDYGSIELGLGVADRYSDSLSVHLQGGPTSHDRQRDDDSPDREHRGAGAAMALDAGRAGDPSSTRDHGHIRIKRNDDTRQVTREAAIAAARASGMLGATAITDADSFHSLVGSVDPSSGFDNANVYAPLYGGSGEARGTFGLARAGDDHSGGCLGGPCGTIGVTRYGTIGNGNVVGDGWGGSGFGAAGGQGGMLGQHTSGVPTIVMCGRALNGCVIGVGGLDKAIIRRYIRRELPKIQYCYEKQLLVTPELGGDVLTDFMIHPDGRVSDVTATGMHDGVAACVADVLAHIEFPKTEQETHVHYPFTFRWSS